MFLLLSLTALTFLCPVFADTRNDQPIIGILAQDVLRGQSLDQWSYIAASYVKTLESAGARIIPVDINQTEAEYKNLFNSINGIFFPGGSVSITSSGYASAARILYNLAIEANQKGDYFPVWGTCLGFEQLGVLTTNVKDKEEILVRTNTTKVSLPLNFTREANGSRMFRDFSAEMMEALATEPLTINAHKWSISMETYHSNQAMKKFYKVLSTNHDGPLEFISTFEAYDYPIYGVQWHPEKSAYEWTRDFYTHCPTAVRVSFFFAEFFVGEARKNFHSFQSEKEARALLIYKHQPTYTGETFSVFEQKYFFPARHQTGQGAEQEAGQGGGQETVQGAGQEAGQGTGQGGGQEAGQDTEKAEYQLSCPRGGAVHLLAQSNVLLVTAVSVLLWF